MKRRSGLFLLLAMLLFLLVSCIDPPKNADTSETTVLTGSEEGTTDLPQSTQPTIPSDPGWTKPY